MDIATAEKVADILVSEFNMDVEVREAYSGRGMYGASVPAFVLDPGDEMFVGYVFGMLDISEDDMPQEIDGMGRRIVLY